MTGRVRAAVMTAAAADDQGDVGLGGRPQLEDLHPMQS